MTHDLWVEVNRESMTNNFRQIRETVGKSIKVMAVIKANGYGHGLIESAMIFTQAGADYLAVTRLAEGIAIRNADIETPILLFSPILAENAQDAIEADLDITVTNIHTAGVISDIAEKIGKKAKVHAKIDTGMSRLGVYPQDAVDFIKNLNQLKNIQLAGVYTHFARATESNFEPTKKQFLKFSEIIDKLDSDNIPRGIAHCANSSATIRMPESRMDMVRVGTLLYGQYPSNHIPKKLKLKNTWALKARVCDVRTLKAGVTVGYGGEYLTPRNIDIAIIPVGFADGFSLVPEGPIYRQSLLKMFFNKLKKKHYIEFERNKLPVLGRVGMQMIVVDKTNAPELKPGDIVSIPQLRIPSNPLIPRVII
ncbi:MAG: alanine racemase [Armatimonadota bacterium]